MPKFSSVSASFGTFAANYKYFYFGVIKDFIDAGLSGTDLFHLRFVLVNCNRTFASSLIGFLFILNYSLRDLSTVSSMPKSSTCWKQGLQTIFECSTNGSSRLQAMLLIRSICVFILKKLLCLLTKLPHNKHDFSLSPVIDFSFKCIRLENRFSRSFWNCKPIHYFKCTLLHIAIQPLKGHRKFLG